MTKTQLLLMTIIFSLSLTACSTNELENVERVKVSFWSGDEKQSEEVAIVNKDEIEPFISATNHAKELDEQTIIKTPPTLTYIINMEENSNKSYHLWIIEDGEGYIQSLLPEDRLTYRLDEDSVKELTTILIKQGDATLLKNIEFEK
ncbi:hypothetical protein [Guptibacillus algicola]|uniref:hypothetical protein n=1 Tax=Guptibacillus algicola TaxID=225844 RepID=UPI001CD6204A|nr:hypothetical protein [Alkalihalobacillus algicola]MCA0987396.1 hypothetical protein [Alkalihalobacillus algicola]